MTTGFILQDGEPLPDIERAPRNARLPRRAWKDVMAAAQVGQFFFVPNRAPHPVAAYVARVSSELEGREFATRRVWAWFDHAAKIWRLGRHDAANAVEGVGVWRTK